MQHAVKKTRGDGVSGADEFKYTTRKRNPLVDLCVVSKRLFLVKCLLFGKIYDFFLIQPCGARVRSHRPG